jgi:hypothetical protein
MESLDYAIGFESFGVNDETGVEDHFHTREMVEIRNRLNEFGQCLYQG